MAKDNADKEKYNAGCSTGNYAGSKNLELLQDYPISTLDDPLVGWLVKKPSEPMPEILMINGVFYQKLKVWRYAE